MSKPRLLFLSQTLPFPPDGGVHIRTFNVLRLLAREFEITALCFFRAATRSSEGAVEAGVEGLKAFARVEAYPIPQERRALRLIADHGRSVATGRPYTVYTYESRAFRSRVAELIGTGDYDLVHLDSLDLSAYLDLLPGVPTVCAHHNVESALLRRRAEAERNPLVRRYLRLQAGFLEREEARGCRLVDMNTAVSERDREEFLRIVPGARFVTVPNGVDTDYFAPAATPAGSGLVFVGGLSWFPNADGLHYFAERIWPLVRSRSPHATVSWVGRAGERARREMKDRYGIQLTGYVEDIRPYVHDAAVYIAPLRVGGGTRLKVLDAWAMGKPIVSTSIGCEGLDARDGENILIRDDPQGFAEATIMLLEDERLRARIGAEARATVERTYGWDVIGEAMLPHYRDLVAMRAPTGMSAAR